MTEPAYTISLPMSQGSGELIIENDVILSVQSLYSSLTIRMLTE